MLEKDEQYLSVSVLYKYLVFLSNFFQEFPGFKLDFLITVFSHKTLPSDFYFQGNSNYNIQEKAQLNMIFPTVT